MKNYYNIAIILSFFGLWLATYLDKASQTYFGFLLILTFGILHGANDLILLKKDNKTTEVNSNFKLLLYYLAIVFLGILSFLIFPSITLFLFVVVSAYHFSEQQWQELNFYFSKKIVTPFYLSYGLAILSLLFIIHSDEVKEVIVGITNVTIPDNNFYATFYTFSGILLIMNLFFWLKVPEIRKKIALELFHLIIFAIIFKSSSLIWGFAIYFILWHSIPSIIDQIKFLEGAFTFRHFISYCKTAWVYWLISLIGLLLLYSVFYTTKIFNILFFSFLAAITFPHVLVITRMFLSKNNK